MISDVEWGSVSLAGAFALGFLFASVVVLRLLKVVFGIIRDEKRKDHDA